MNIDTNTRSSTDQEIITIIYNDLKKTNLTKPEIDIILDKIASQELYSLMQAVKCLAENNCLNADTFKKISVRTGKNNFSIPGTLFLIKSLKEENLLNVPNIDLIFKSNSRKKERYVWVAMMRKLFHMRYINQHTLNKIFLHSDFDNLIDSFASLCMSPWFYRSEYLNNLIDQKELKNFSFITEFIPELLWNDSRLFENYYDKLIQCNAKLGNRQIVKNTEKKNYLQGQLKDFDMLLKQCTEAETPEAAIKIFSDMPTPIQSEDVLAGYLPRTITNFGRRRRSIPFSAPNPEHKDVKQDNIEDNVSTTINDNLLSGKYQKEINLIYDYLKLVRISKSEIDEILFKVRTIHVNKLIKSIAFLDRNDCLTKNTFTKISAPINNLNFDSAIILFEELQRQKILNEHNIDLIFHIGASDVERIVLSTVIPNFVSMGYINQNTLHKFFLHSDYENLIQSLSHFWHQSWFFEIPLVDKLLEQQNLQNLPLLMSLAPEHLWEDNILAIMYYEQVLACNAKIAYHKISLSKEKKNYDLVTKEEFITSNPFTKCLKVNTPEAAVQIFQDTPRPLTTEEWLRLEFQKQGNTVPANISSLEWWKSSLQKETNPMAANMSFSSDIDSGNVHSNFLSNENKREKRSIPFFNNNIRNSSDGNYTSEKIFFTTVLKDKQAIQPLNHQQNSLSSLKVEPFSSLNGIALLMFTLNRFLWNGKYSRKNKPKVDFDSKLFSNVILNKQAESYELLCKANQKYGENTTSMYFGR